MVRCIALCLLVFLVPAPAFADKFISVAVSDTTSNSGPAALGIGVGETDAEADEVAIKTCREYHGTSCQIVEQQKGGCVALAKAAGVPHDGVGLAPTEKTAIEEALKNCGDGGKYSGCSISHNACYD